MPDDDECPECDGTGVMVCQVCNGDGDGCKACDGDGGEECDECDGSGIVEGE